MINEMPGTMIASQQPMKNLTAMRPDQLLHAGIKRAIADQPMEQQQMYFAEGNL